MDVRRPSKLGRYGTPAPGKKLALGTDKNKMMAYAVLGFLINHFKREIVMSTPEQQINEQSDADGQLSDRVRDLGKYAECARQECINAHYEVSRLAAYVQSLRMLADGRSSDSVELTRNDVDLLLETIQEKAEAVLGDLRGA